MFNVHPYCFVYTWLILFFATEYKSMLKVHCSLLMVYPVIEDLHVPIVQPKIQHEARSLLRLLGSRWV